MKTRGSNQNLKKAADIPKSREASTKPTASATGTPKINSWQPLMILFVEGSQQNCWLVDSATDIHIYNDKSNMIEYQDYPTQVGRSTSDGVLPGKSKIRLRLGLHDNSESLILNLHNMYYFPNSPCILLSFGLLNNSGIYYDNEHKSLYQVRSRKTLVQAKRWRNSFLLNPLNLSDSAVYLLRVDADPYQPLHAFWTSTSLFFILFSIWHKPLGYLNFSSLKSHLNRLDIKYKDDFHGYISDNCLWTKATKTYNRKS